MSKYCKVCGNELSDDQQICMKCGCAAASNSNTSVANQETDIQGFEGECIGFGILSFVMPIVGIILFCVWIKKRRTRAIFCGVAGVISGVISIVIKLIIMYG